MNTRHESIFSDPNVVTKLSPLHEYFVIVTADKTSNNYTFVCKKYYVVFLIEDFLLHLLPGNPTYNLTDLSASEVLDNYKSVFNSFGIRQMMKSWICPTLIGFIRCTKIPTNTDLLRVHRSIRPSLYLLYSQHCLHIFNKVFRSTAKQPTKERSGINRMLILKNSKEFLEHLKSPHFNLVTSIKSFDFSTLYTTIPHQKLKSRLATIIRNSSIHKNGNR